jgi:DNA-binding XRE family transcriptional regulator
MELLDEYASLLRGLETPSSGEPLGPQRPAWVLLALPVPPGRDVRDAWVAAQSLVERLGAVTVFRNEPAIGAAPRMPLRSADDFGTVLRRLRVAAHLSQEELADKAALSAKAVSALERGTRTRPYRATVDALARALALSEDERAALEAARRPL